MTPQHASHSSIELWLNCGKRYELQKIQRVPEPPAWYLIGGSAVHTATEWLDTNHYDLPESAWEAAFEQEIEQARERWPAESEWLAAGFTEAKKQRREHWAEKGLGYVEQWASRDNPDWAGIELDVSTVLPSGVEVKAYVDRIHVEDAVATIWDLKTSSKRPESDQQLGIYRVLLEHRYPEFEVGSAGLYMFKDDKFHEQDTSGWDLQAVDKVAQDWMRGVDSGIFLPKRSTACRTCSMRAACYLESGNTAATRKYDPLNPNYQGSTEISGRESGV